MSRWDYDVVFYRVFCVTLLAVGFTFTVILTNVFVDIDGLLSNKKKNILESTTFSKTIINDEENPMEELKDILSNEDKNYDTEINPPYRTKRSIETDTLYHAKNPEMKKMLTRRLASLLEELDDEEAKKELKVDVTTVKSEVSTSNKEESVFLQNVRNENLLHVAMHNILLQGLIGHMDLNDVYKKVHNLLQTFNKRVDSKKLQGELPNILKSIANSKEILRDIPADLLKHNNYNTEEHKFLEELIKCKELEDQVGNTSHSNEMNATNEYQNRKNHEVFIKTVIEINEKDNMSISPNETHPKRNIEGLVKLIYNGKSIKINQMHDDIKQQNKSKNKLSTHAIEKNKNLVINKNNKLNSEFKNTEQNNNNRKHKQNPFVNQVLEEYLKKHSIQKFEYLQNSAEVEGIKTQRSKRQIKIRYTDNNETSSKIKTSSKLEGLNKDDDDLYIEIETHYDGKGIKGEKKKKLVRNLIDKIQKALHSDIEEKRDSVEHIKFVKRTQDPINSKNKDSYKKEEPLEPIEHRLLDPIGKTLDTHEKVADRLGDTWKKQYYGPRFLSYSKAVNSAEMNDVSVEYDSVFKDGVPKRFQAPINTGADRESNSNGLLNPDTGNVTLFLKDIDGSGFSIGFNQYEGEPPDKDSMQMFNGIENLIKEYHKTYDQDNNISNESPVNKVDKVGETYHTMVKRNVDNLHKVYRRSITEVGANYYNANIFKIFFKENPSFNSYLNLFKRRNHSLKFHSKIENVDNIVYGTKNHDMHLSRTNLSFKEVPIMVDERILSKKLKPFEIFSIANLLNRKRRSLSVKKISNLKSKIKLNRFLNTKAMATKKLFIKNRRNKRHVNNIRITARERPRTSQKSSDENLFFFSKENPFADKETMIRAVKTADTKINNKNTEYMDDESPFSNIYRIQNPNMQTGLTESVYNTNIRSNGLMSKYPHIILDKTFDSKEEVYFDNFEDETQYRSNDKPYRIEASTIGNKEMERTTEQILATVLQNLSVPRVEEIVGAMMPPITGSNYRITVKMSPKNKTSTNSGFKEIHTSVNKSYDDNGLRYYTMVNVSQISKVEKLNTTKEVDNPLNDRLIAQQKHIKALLRLHKKRVDLQLSSLLRESNHLNKMIESNKEYNVDKTIKLLSDDDNSLDTVDREKFKDSVRKMQENTESKQLITTPTTSTPVTIILPSTINAANIDKPNIIDNINRNEIVTSEILKKIDTNTQMLQTFLQKISDLHFNKNEHTTVKATERSALEMKLDLSKDWKSYGGEKDGFFVPNELKNDTVPFIYAYQQNIPMKNKFPSESLASLVYHGHIHTNSLHNLNNNNFNKPKIKPTILNADNRRKSNESKFFLDRMANVPNIDRVITAKIKINTTSIV